ncbi:MAG TPA: primosomal replication protein N [Burkholderiales bacterium]|nr:primosomal replication protein N [Burkholderiales bacterium]
MNRAELTGRIVELGALRFTPAGIPVVDFRLEHESEQDEAGGRRKVTAEIGAVAFDAQARLLATRAMGSEVTVRGFLAAKRKGSKRLVLHVTDIEFSEGA